MYIARTPKRLLGRQAIQKFGLVYDIPGAFTGSAKRTASAAECQHSATKELTDRSMAESANTIFTTAKDILRQFLKLLT